jgi:nucleoside 2-deoxyribosyltransferase
VAEKMIVVYVAGPYRAETPWLIEDNIRRAETYSLILWRHKFVALCPHTQTRFFQGSAPDHVFLEGTLEMMRRCDAVFLLPGWEKSSGTRGELHEANRLGIPAFESLGQLLSWRMSREHGAKGAA